MFDLTSPGASLMFGKWDDRIRHELNTFVKITCIVVFICRLKGGWDLFIGHGHIYFLKEGMCL